jgi:predicted pyridoxine 5'-phosphate oxidase superfamily flavin-nucleotide-binding protein
MTEEITAVQEQSVIKAAGPSILPGSDGEHMLQEKYGTVDRASAFYNAQVLDYLAPLMQEYIAKQENLFVATADRHGECDCTSKFGSPGFIRVLNEKYLIYPEFRGNGVLANSGNIMENPHIAMLIIDFYKDTVGLHVNGKARVVENAELLEYREHLPKTSWTKSIRRAKNSPSVG